jgi:hypothetical protein
MRKDRDATDRTGIEFRDWFISYCLAAIRKERLIADMNQRKKIAGTVPTLPPALMPV